MNQEVKTVYRGKNIPKVMELLGETRYQYKAEIYEFSEPQYGESDFRIKFNSESVIHTGFGISSGSFTGTKPFTERLHEEGFIIRNIQTHIEEDGTISLILYTKAPNKTSFNLYEYNHVQVTNGLVKDLRGKKN